MKFALLPQSKCYLKNGMKAMWPLLETSAGYQISQWYLALCCFCLPTRRWEVATSNHSLLHNPPNSLTFSRGVAQKDHTFQCPALTCWSVSCSSFKATTNSCAWWAERVRAAEGRALPSEVSVRIPPEAGSQPTRCTKYVLVCTHVLANITRIFICSLPFL